MRKTLLVIITTITISFVFAQKDHLSSKAGESALGVGLGLPYGGIGLRFGTNVGNHFNLFGGLGYQFAGLGYNFGVLTDFASSSQTQLYLTGMYGTNAGIIVKGSYNSKQLFSGVTFGAGIKINSRRNEGNYWDLGLLVPIRSSGFKDRESELRNQGIDLDSPSPIAIVFGYNF